MLRAALRDLQWRWKRFVIAMVGVALVLQLAGFFWIRKIVNIEI